MRVSCVANKADTSLFGDPFGNRVSPQKLVVNKAVRGDLFNDVAELGVPTLYTRQHIPSITSQIPILCDIRQVLLYVSHDQNGLCRHSPYESRSKWRTVEQGW